VVDKPVTWSELAGIGNQTIHRVWQELSRGRTTLWHELSQDNGETWGRTSPASIFGETVGNPSLAWDSAGRLHLLQLVSRGSQSFVLQHWLWNGERWATERTLDLEQSSVSEIGELVSIISNDNILAVLFSGVTIARDGGQRLDNLFFSDRPLDESQAVSTLNPELTPVAAVAASPTPEPTQVPATPVPTPTQPVPVNTAIPELPEETDARGNPWMAAILVPTAAVITILVFILIASRILSRR
jgi:hypothetical protein